MRVEAEAGAMWPQPGDPSHPRTWARKGGLSPEPQCEGGPADPWAQASGLQDYERINPCPLL